MSFETQRFDDTGDWQDEHLAVLASGGLDSSVLIGDLANRSAGVTPIYVRLGLVWEAFEQRALRRFLDRLGSPNIGELQIFRMPIGEVYGDHWSTNGLNTPDQHSPDDAVFLPGRNFLLLSQAAIWCSLNQIEVLALAVLENNPFPDSTADFFDSFETVLGKSIPNTKVRIIRPYARLSKREVMQRGKKLPLEETFSCIRPIGSFHCGTCNKCAERRQAFASAEIPDRTRYADRQSANDLTATKSEK